MKNITISVTEADAKRIRVAAANAGQSVSRYLVEAGMQRLETEEADIAATRRNRQIEAIERILAGPMWDVTTDGHMPTSEERNARR